MLQRTQPHPESCWPTTTIFRRTGLVSSRWYQAWRLFPDMTLTSTQFDVIVSHLDEPEVRPEFACWGGNVLLWDKALSSLFNECPWRVGYLVKMALKPFESTVVGLNQILSRSPSHTSPPKVSESSRSTTLFDPENPYVLLGGCGDFGIVGYQVIISATTAY